MAYERSHAGRLLFRLESEDSVGLSFWLLLVVLSIEGRYRSSAERRTAPYT